MFKKIIFFTSGLILCLAPFCVAVAAENTSPEKNPLCWTKDDCVDAREQFVGEGKAGDGWLQDQDCSGDWGKCLAGGVAKTQVVFGGQTKFNDIGAYIKTFYNYSISIIGVIATVVIIISGLQWASSAGNSEIISSAKTRIGGALIGSFIAFMSYIILNTINPATVNLQLPHVYLVRSIPLPLKWCQDYAADVFDDNTVFSIDDAYLDTMKSKVKAYDITQYKGTKMKKSETRCGLQYIVPRSANDTCLGNNCDGMTVMSPEDMTKTVTCGTAGAPCACYTAGGSAPFCLPSFFGGSVKLADIDHHVIDVTLWTVCVSTKTPDVVVGLADLDSADIGEALEKNYGIVFTESNLQREGDLNCGVYSKMAGLVLTAEVADSDSGPTIDDTWLIGKSSCGNGKDPFAGMNLGDMEESDWDIYDYQQILSAMVAKGEIWTAEEAVDGVTCDLDISMANYPNLSDDLYKP